MSKIMLKSPTELTRGEYAELEPVNINEAAWSKLAELYPTLKPDVWQDQKQGKVDMDFVPSYFRSYCAWGKLYCVKVRTPEGYRIRLLAPKVKRADDQVMR